MYFINGVIEAKTLIEQKLRKTIMILGPIPKEGGVTTFIEELIRISLQKDYITCIVTFTKAKNSSNFIVNYSSPFLVKFFLPKDFYDFLIFTLKNEVTFTISNVYYSCMLSLLKSKAKIHVLHGFGNLETNFLKFIIGNLSNIIGYKFSQKVIANSYLTSSVNRVFGVKYSVVTPWGIPKNFELDTVKESFQRDIDLLYVGRICLTKGLMLILKALSRILNNSNQRINFHLVGALKENLKTHQELQQASLDNITYHGYLEKEKIVEIYSRSKLFISLNPEEPFGFTYVEALACGTPIIVPKGCGIAPFLDSRLALLVDMNEHSISETIEYGLSKSWDANEIVSVTRNIFSWERVNEIIFDAYK
jgi:glycosyltransferase involved in cell wall biosynthesis